MFFRCFLKPVEIALKIDSSRKNILPCGIQLVHKKHIDQNNYKLLNFESIRELIDKN